jgi:hypothetical protein
VSAITNDVFMAKLLVSCPEPIGAEMNARWKTHRPA